MALCRTNCGRWPARSEGGKRPPRRFLGECRAIGEFTLCPPNRSKPSSSPKEGFHACLMTFPAFRGQCFTIGRLQPAMVEGDGSGSRRSPRFECSPGGMPYFCPKGLPP
jgi:hypothetical protein